MRKTDQIGRDLECDKQTKRISRTCEFEFKFICDFDCGAEINWSSNWKGTIIVYNDLLEYIFKNQLGLKIRQLKESWKPVAGIFNQFFPITIFPVWFPSKAFTHTRTILFAFHLICTPNLTVRMRETAFVLLALSFHGIYISNALNTHQQSTYTTPHQPNSNPFIRHMCARNPKPYPSIQ